MSRVSEAIRGADVALAADIKRVADRLHTQVRFHDAKAIHRLAVRADALGWGGTATALHDSARGSVKVDEVQMTLWECALVILGEQVVA